MRNCEGLIWRRHFVTASRRCCSVHMCVFVCVFDQGTCCKITGKWHPFKHEGPAGGLLLFAFTHTRAFQPVHVVVNRIQSAAAFCQCVYVDSSLWGLSKEPFTENNDSCRLAF